MDQGFLHRSLWTSENKFPHHHIMDFFTSVEVTQDIPKGTAFGPCVLHNTFYDTIAFIALKSSDKRNKSYVFRADPDAMKGSPLVVPWLRLVQAAMSTEDQNTEAFLKSGQLHFQTIRDVKQGEELLVWYDEELSNLLGFGDIKTKAFTDGFKCLKCGQIFKHEFPFLAHCRFLCHQDKVDSTNSDQKPAEVKRPRKVIDFHNIARDLEHKINTSPEDAEFPRKRRHETSPSPRHKKTVLLEKTNISNHENTSDVNADDSLHQTVTEQAKHSKLFKYSAFTEVKKPNEASPRDVTPSDVSLQSDCSAFTFVLPKRVHADPKSAFCEPIKHAFADPDDISGAFKPNSSPEYRNVLASNLFPGELSAGVMSPPHPSSFFHAPEHWTRATGAPLQSSSLTLLPPTFTPLGVSVQNWCAKCNLSFRMTSDLVFHMRSHHKKEFAAEAQVRRRREEKLTCPICHEYFRERHHLSRHMTSHS